MSQRAGRFPRPANLLPAVTRDFRTQPVNSTIYPKKDINMIDRHRRTVPGLVVALLIPAAMQLALANQAAAQVNPSAKSGLKLYDNFDSAYLDPARWYAQWGCSTATTMECVRQIQEGRLHLRARAYGNRTSNIDTVYGNSEIYLIDSAATEFSAGIRVLRADSAGCTTSPGSGTHGHALLWGTFFNGGGGTANDDVLAFLVFDRWSTDPPNVVTAAAFMQYQGVFTDPVYLGPVNVGEHVTADLKWDRANHQFVAKLVRPANNTTVQVTLPYTMSDVTPAVAPQKALGARSFPENCIGTETFADMEAAFDRVMTN
jgi:hypothetical protein